jgi:hypothetical protein
MNEKHAGQYILSIYTIKAFHQFRNVYHISNGVFEWLEISTDKLNEKQ